MTKHLKPIDPHNITDFHRDSNNKELFLIFAIAVAGKSSDVTARKINRMFNVDKDCMPAELPELVTETMRWSATLVCTYLKDGVSPFGVLKGLVDNKILGSFLELHSIGQYHRIGKAYDQISRTRGGIHVINQVTVDDLVKYDGIGPKTARFFMLHSFPNCNYAVLDTHILRHIAEYVELSLGLIRKFQVPRTTPQIESEYKFWETFFLGMCNQAGRSTAEYDLATWNNRSKKTKEVMPMV